MNPKMEWRTFVRKMTDRKNNLLILFLVGMLLVVLSIPTKKNEEVEREKTENQETKSTKKRYESEMEQRLSEILSDVNGVGENEVMITLKSTAEKVVEKDRETDETAIREETVYTGGREEEMPYIKKEMTPTIEGVVVIAEGGDDPVTIQNITEAVQALFNVDTHKIKVMKMNE